MPMLASRVDKHATSMMWPLFLTVKYHRMLMPLMFSSLHAYIHAHFHDKECKGNRKWYKINMFSWQSGDSIAWSYTEGTAGDFDNCKYTAASSTKFKIFSMFTDSCIHVYSWVYVCVFMDTLHKVTRILCFV